MYLGFYVLLLNQALYKYKMLLLSLMIFILKSNFSYINSATLFYNYYWHDITFPHFYLKFVSLYLKCISFRQSVLCVPMPFNWNVKLITSNIAIAILYLSLNTCFLHFPHLFVFSIVLPFPSSCFLLDYLNIFERFYSLYWILIQIY